MEKEAKMSVTADQRPLWNTRRRPEDSSPRAASSAAIERRLRRLPVLGDLPLRPSHPPVTARLLRAAPDDCAPAMTAAKRC
jgi:hypothetical protein